MQKNKLIDFDNEHSCILGQTQSGKTTGVIKSLEQHTQGVLFFNTQHIQVGKKWVTANYKNDVQNILIALSMGVKINYIPSREFRQQELSVIINELYLAAEKKITNLYIIIDEVHLYRNEALKSCVEVATTGLRWGIKAVYISQRPAKVENDLLTQCTKYIFFDVSEMELQYMKSYQLPFEEIKQKLRSAGQYAYVMFHKGIVYGAYRVN
jgi:predicted AAA+ superfamily ATPase